VIAGYHWFADWGRDTMIALAGLTLATGRSAEGAQILRAFAPFVADGFLRVAYGGAEVGHYLTGHRLVDSVHITGAGSLRLAALVTFLPLLPLLALLYRLPESSQMELT